MSRSLQVWHMTEDSPRRPRRVAPGDAVEVCVGTRPVGPSQRVSLEVRELTARGTIETRAEGRWERNEEDHSYWSAQVGPFARGARVEYTVRLEGPEGTATCGPYAFRVGPRIHLALLWHQHQPLYRIPSSETRPTLQQPWVRLHSLRDYYSMAALVGAYANVHVTFNLTPVLLSQIDDYTQRRGTDRHLQLTLKPAGRLTAGERHELLGTFFDADWHRQIFTHPRYRELFELRTRREAFGARDLRDLQMWSNLAWFGKEFRDGPVELVTGEVVDVHRFVGKARDFTVADVRSMVEQQWKVMRAVVPVHRALQEAGQIEIATTPFHHPILPLLIDTDEAVVDLDGATLPKRFSRIDDAREHVRRARSDYQGRFGVQARGMWPAEGAVSPKAVELIATEGVTWLASDRGVLARSGRWGYRVDDPDVLCRPYLAGEGTGAVSMFFRDTPLSDAIGFRYGSEAPEAAASAFVREIEERFSSRLPHDEDRVVTVILDGENAWGGYEDDGRPFLQALYRLLSNTPSIQTVTFSEYLAGNRARGVVPHPAEVRVYDLFTGSWIDEVRSRPGVDLGTWIGEPEENRAWELLGAARARVDTAPVEARARALEAVYAAEGSDWFWWFGDDQSSGNDDRFDDLFRAHVRRIYEELEEPWPAELAVAISTPSVVWSFSQPVDRVSPGERVVVQTNCPGSVTWHYGDRRTQTTQSEPVGGVLAGSRRFHAALGPVPPDASLLDFEFSCGDCSCGGRGACCGAGARQIRVQADAS